MSAQTFIPTSCHSESNSLFERYLSISPEIPLGYCAEGLASDLVESAERIHKFSKQPGKMILGGWIALEAATYVPGSAQRQELVDIAEDRFMQVSEFKTSDEPYKRRLAYDARLGLITLNAYQQPLEDALYDTPGMYTEILEDLRREKFVSKDFCQRSAGLIGEVVVGAAISSQEILALPASARHDKPQRPGSPSMARDIEVWQVLPRSLPLKPDRLVQVKTNSSDLKDMNYAEEIIPVCTDSTYCDKFYAIADAFKHLYDGLPLTWFYERIVSRTQQATLKALRFTQE
jgi:hypothetical protein